MVELVDALDSKSSARKGVGVRFSPGPPSLKPTLGRLCCLPKYKDAISFARRSPRCSPALALGGCWAAPALSEGWAAPCAGRNRRVLGCACAFGGLGCAGAGGIGGCWAAPALSEGWAAPAPGESEGAGLRLRCMAICGRSFFFSWLEGVEE